MPDAIRVLCVDDHPLIRDGIAFALREADDMILVAQAANGEEAIASYRLHRPDVTLMDLRMPVMNGITATAEIVKEFPMARIVIVTTSAGDIQAARALQAGARGFLLKGMLRTDLIGTIRLVHAGQHYVASDIALDIKAHKRFDELSDREIEVLRHVATGVPNKTVAESLGISEDAVKDHMRHVLTKLGASDRSQAVMIALQRGYLEGWMF